MAGDKFESIDEYISQFPPEIQEKIGDSTKSYQKVYASIFHIPTRCPVT